MKEWSALFNSFGDSSTVFSFFPSESHKKAVHRITVGLESNCGLVMLTGEIGTGKTTLFRYIQHQSSEKIIYADVGNPFLSPMEQVCHFCKCFGLESPQNLRQGISNLTSFFEQQHREGKQVVLIFDEAHLLTKAHWGQILVFSNLRKNDEPIVQILLVGQTELVDRLMEPGLEALNQRVGIRCELSPLTLEDTRKYVCFKLNSSGVNDIEFPTRALNEVWKLSRGVPRLINHACSHLLDQLFFSANKEITPAMVKKLASDGVYANLFDSKSRRNKKFSLHFYPSLMTVLFLLTAFFLYSNWEAGKYLSGLNKAENEVTGNEGGKVALSDGSKNRVGAQPKRILNDEAGQAGRTGKHVSSDRQKALSGHAAVVEHRVVSGLGPGVVRAAVWKNSLDRDAKAESRQSALSSSESTGPFTDSGKESSSESVPAEKRAEYAAKDAVTNEIWKSNNSAIISAKKSGLAAGETKNTVATAKIMDGELVPEIASIKIGAVAYNDSPESRIAVLNQKLMHQGEAIGKVRLDSIGKDSLIFSFGNKKYFRAFGDQYNRKK